MDGGIIKELGDMIVERCGEGKCEDVRSGSGAREDSLLAMRSYDDSITDSLAQAASEVLDAPLDTCLEMFGKYWVLETATKSYEILLNAAGQDLVEFLTNLNALHDRITSTFLNYSPPEFHIEEKEDHHLIHYVSQREGLTPFVVGLLKGLAIRFGREIDILSQTEVDVDQGAHTIFEIKLS